MMPCVTIKKLLDEVKTAIIFHSRKTKIVRLAKREGDGASVGKGLLTFKIKVA